MPDPYAAWLARDVVEATGPEAEVFLQGQVSQDVSVLGDGGSTWSWVLAPTGKVDALVRVTRLSGQEWLLDTDAGWGEALAGRLNKFRLRTKVTIGAREWKVLGLRGGTPEPPAGAIAVPAWPGLVGIDLLGPSPQPPEGWRIASPEEGEADRIAAGMPLMGQELDDKTIPGETGLIDLTVSFTKGCYTGQELVARIDSRGGNVPRHLRRMRAPKLVPAGSELSGADGRAGVVTSAAVSPVGGCVALGYVKRGIPAPSTLSADVGGETVAVEVLAP